MTAQPQGTNSALVVLLGRARRVPAVAVMVVTACLWHASNAAEVSSPAPAASDAEEVLQADPRQALLRRFSAAAAPGSLREHVLNMEMNAYADSSESPGLRLNRMWVSDQGALLELEGLVAKGPASAVIREDTLTLRHEGGVATAQEVEGASRLLDRKGGYAIVIRPGDKVLVRFGAIDDLHPMRLYHISPDGSPYVYFENIDPRFKERYLASYQTAAAADATPGQMKDFLVDFARNDPDKKAPEIFLKLINRMRAQNTFEGYYHAYLLLQAPEDAIKASRLVRTDQHKAMLEHMAVQTLTDKTRLFDFDLTLQRPSTHQQEGRCFIACRYNYGAFAQIGGELAVRPRQGSPIKLKQGVYKLTFTADVQQPRHKVRQSRWLGNYDGPDTGQVSNTVTVVVRPPDYRTNVRAALGEVMVAFVQRGSMGGVEASYANSNATVTLALRSVELVP
jgi:hypothetical protein